MLNSLSLSFLFVSVPQIIVFGLLVGTIKASSVGDSETVKYSSTGLEAVTGVTTVLLYALLGREGSFISGVVGNSFDIFSKSLRFSSDIFTVSSVMGSISSEGSPPCRAYNKLVVRKLSSSVSPNELNTSSKLATEHVNAVVPSLIHLKNDKLPL